MTSASLTFAFTAGLVATINPCGFAMLPAYLSYFLGTEEAEALNEKTGIGRALITGLTVSSGFVAVFSIIGLLVSAGLSAVRQVVPWLTIFIGSTLIALGIAFILGYRLRIFLPNFKEGPDNRNLKSLFFFGVSYAIASISCGLPTFIVVVSTSANNFTTGLISFFAYSIGMALVLTALTISLAIARQSLLVKLRLFLPKVDRLAGSLMIMAGMYLVVFWITERLGASPNRVILEVESWSASLSNQISNIGGVRVGVSLSIIVSAAMIFLLSSPKENQLTDDSST
ncbi:MAG: cytochrome c biogenesis CcdA family protein [Acidimicrobiales bacterium]|jgi:cytochrome c biogenesis protein CcdA|nr:cytochrome c biogenesis CcdA family protein [Acidimicrobiales bacterium]